MKSTFAHDFEMDGECFELKQDLSSSQVRYPISVSALNNKAFKIRMKFNEIIQSLKYIKKIINEKALKNVIN